MKNSSLSQKALLVSVNISQWTGRRLDREATETVVKAHSTTQAAGAYTKKLLPNAVELETISALSSYIRKYFYEQTLPWMTDGTRIISSKNHLKFATEFRKLKSEYDKAVNEFIAAYPKRQAEAQKTLGGLFKLDEYPKTEELASKFSCDVDYFPLPDEKDFRVQISENEKKNFIKKMREVESQAMRDCWTRLHDTVKKAADRLASPDAIFKDALIENIREICALLPMLNVSDNADLEKSRSEVESIVNNLSSDILRDNKLERNKTAKKLQEITSAMGAFMGKA